MIIGILIKSFLKLLYLTMSESCCNSSGVYVGFSFVLYGVEYWCGLAEIAPSSSWQSTILSHWQDETQSSFRLPASDIIFFVQYPYFKYRVLALDGIVA